MTCRFLSATRAVFGHWPVLAVLALAFLLALLIFGRNGGMPRRVRHPAGFKARYVAVPPADFDGSFPEILVQPVPGAFRDLEDGNCAHSGH